MATKTTAPINDEDLPILTANSAAKILDLSARTITWLAMKGRLACVRDGANRRLYTLKEIRRYQQEQQARRARELKK
jgi:DNA-binding transcriptional MerR regulator